MAISNLRIMDRTVAHVGHGAKARRRRHRKNNTFADRSERLLGLDGSFLIMAQSTMPPFGLQSQPARTSNMHHRRILHIRP